MLMLEFMFCILQIYHSFCTESLNLYVKIRLIYENTVKLHTSSYTSL